MKNKHNTMNSSSSQKTYMRMLSKINHVPNSICMLNVKDLNYTNGLTVNFVSKEDTNIIFSTQKCIRKEKVSKQPIN